jgi:hypothetical protein
VSKKGAPCYGVDQALDGLRDRYARLALVAHERHLAQLDLADTDTLIVSFDWLVWQKSAADGLHCLPAEWGILAWQGSDTLASDLMIRVNDWVYADGRDATMFHGASLCKPIAAQTLLFQTALIRLSRMLGPIFERFGAAEVLYFDCRAETNALDAETRRIVARTAAQEHGLAFIDRGDPVDANDNRLPFSPEGANAPTRRHRGRWWKDSLVWLYGRSLDTWSRLVQRLVPGHRNILLLINTALSAPLLAAFDDSRLRPVLSARSQPKGWRFLVKCLPRGILLVAPPLPRLTDREKADVRGIVGRLERAWATPATVAESLLRTYLRRSEITEEHLFAAAREVKRAAALLDAFTPARIVVDGVRNAPLRYTIDLAHERGIPVDYIWHSPWAPDNQKFDALGGDPRCPPLIARCLSWGRVNDRWLDVVGARCARVLTGCPIGQGAPSAEPPPGLPGRALVLEYNVSSVDLPGLYANKYVYFVEVLRLLRRRGLKRIVFKVHPGRPRKEYYEPIAAHFGIECKIAKHQPLGELLAETDVVIGPVHSGAMPESLAAGKPYYGLMIPPTSMDADYYRGLNVITNLGGLEAAMDAGASLDPERTLRDLYATGEITDACARIWEVLGNDVSPEPVASAEVLARRTRAAQR